MGEDEFETFGFGEILEKLIDGKRNGKTLKATNHNWNGSGMFIFIGGAYQIPKEEARKDSLVNEDFLTSQGQEKLGILPHLDMWTDNKEYMTGWVPNQFDLFCGEWFLVD